MSATNLYTAVACNRTPEAADWGKNGLIAFAACNAIAILDPQCNGSSKIQQTFVEHTAKVNTVKWISDTELLSGSYDKQCIHWDIADRTRPIVKKLLGHEAGITFVDAIRVDGSWTMVTTSLDSTIRLWQWNAVAGEYETFDSINLGNGFCFAIRTALLPGTRSSILLAVATDDNNIRLYSGCALPAADQSRKFTQLDTLVGHADWVRGLDFVTISDTELLLASSSQDTFIRLWRIAARSKKDTEPHLRLTKGGLPVGDEDIQIEERIVTVSATDGPGYSFAVSLESVLSGHDGWVYGLHWCLHADDAKLQLLSSSIDKTLIIWEVRDGVWIENMRVGEVGGNSLGFYGGKFSPDGKSIFGHGYQGSFHMWHRDESNAWSPGVVCGGHSAEVRDLCWDPLGQFLLTVSADQTTRCHGPWVRDGVKTEQQTWHEIARPQVHGYDMQTICALSRYRFASGAEEKIVRTFQAPANFVHNFRRICGIAEDPEGDAILKTSPEGASVPSLGLSNKAVYEGTDIRSTEERHIKDQYPENYFVPSNLNEPPSEETLMQNTLWPEMQKLYGHGYEIFALAASPDGKVLASSCKATNEEHARIILWNTSTWKYVQKLCGHQLTVTQMKFSPDNKYLLSVGRDRRWCIFENRPADAADDSICNFELIATTDKKNGIHSRIIWTCDWAHDSTVFATGSRDARAVIWTHGDTDSQTSLGAFKAIGTLDLAKNDSVTAIAFGHGYQRAENGHYLIAVGLETGLIQLYSFATEWSHLFTIDRSLAHSLTVRKLAFRPQAAAIELASCGEDQLIRVHRIEL